MKVVSGAILLEAMTIVNRVLAQMLAARRAFWSPGIPNYGYISKTKEQEVTFDVDVIYFEDDLDYLTDNIRLPLSTPGEFDHKDKYGATFMKVRVAVTESQLKRLVKGRRFKVLY